MEDGKKSEVERSATLWTGADVCQKRDVHTEKDSESCGGHGRQSNHRCPAGGISVCDYCSADSNLEHILGK